MNDKTPFKYDRPTQKWLCGWACEGKACPIGPDARGRCVARYECAPIQREDRWFCTRPNAFGGVCEDGPLPDGTCCRAIPQCQPVLSTRAKRGSLSKWISLAILGILLLFLSGPVGPTFISPGKMASPHKPIAQDCKACHSSFEGGPGNWVYAAFFATQSLDDSDRCLACHVLGEEGRLAHGVSESLLSTMTERVKLSPTRVSVAGRVASSLSLSNWPTSETSMPCSTCHQEHRGNVFNLKSMSNQKCQACHSLKFNSFEQDHSEFSNFPYNRRTRLSFDHNSHMNKHFKTEVKDLAPTTCRGCHLLDQSGRDMTVAKFENACASCHEAQILGDGEAGTFGFSFFSIPGLDLDALKEASLEMGEWPKDSEVEDIPSFMRLLLLADPEFRSIESVVKDLDLMDMEGADKEKKKAAQRLAWSIKGLLFELVTQGQQGLRRRLETTLGRKLKESELSHLAAQLPIDVIRSAQKSWFPKLATEMKRREKGSDSSNIETSKEEKTQKAETDEKAEDPNPDADASIVGGWFRQDFSVIYRPTGHEDRFLRGWLDLTGGAGGTFSEEARQSIFAALSNEKTPGKCVKCHSIDQKGEKSFQVNWKPKQPAVDKREFTRFNHAPHFSLLDEKGCRTCHTMNVDADPSVGYKDYDPQTFTSNFEDVPKALCAKCHTSGRASNNCLTCHNYHIGHLKPAIKNAEFLKSVNIEK